MDERDNSKHDFLKVGTPLCGIVTGIAGAIIALMLIFIGFWNTVLVALFFAIGYVFGSCTDKAEKFKVFINKVFPPKGE